MRKGQVTLFVLLGLALLLVAAIFIIMRSVSIGDPALPPLTTHDFSAVVASYEQGVEACLRPDGTRIFQELLSHGGYLDTSQFTVIEAAPTRGNAVSLGGLVVPYWFEHRSSASCKGVCPFRYSVPPLTKRDGALSVELQVQQALLSSARSCLDAYKPGPDYSITFDEDPQILVTIGLEAVTYTHQRSVTFTFLPTNTTKTVSTVNVESSARVRQLFGVAEHLLFELEINNETASMPRLAKLLIQAYSMGEQQQIPPMDGGVILSNERPKSWMLDQVEPLIRTYLADNIPLVRIKGTRSDALFLDENYYSLALYSGQEFNPDLILPYPDFVSDLSIDLVYLPSWPLDVSIGSSYYITPEFTPLSPIPGFPLGLAKNRFAYDLIYPVVVVITDEQSFDGAGATLLFAFESGLRQSKPITYHVSSVEELDVHAFDTAPALMEGVVSITAFDNLTGQKLTGISVSYQCGEIFSFITQLEEESAQEHFPQCLGGLVLAQKQGYSFDPTPLSVIGDNDYQVVLFGVPNKEFVLDVRTRDIYKIADFPMTVWGLAENQGYMSPDDRLIYVFTKNSPFGDDDVQAGELNWSNRGAVMVSLGKGSYDVQVFLMRYFGEGYSQERFVIPSRDIEVDDQPLVPGVGEHTETIPEIVFNSSMYLGGLVMAAAENTSLVINNSQYDSGKITLNVMQVYLPHVVIAEDLESLDLIEQFSKQYRAQLSPSLS